MSTQSVPDWVASATRELSERARVRSISLAELEELRASGGPHYAVDVRLPAEYRAGHIPGPIPIPTGQFA
ncbi:MAG TPA: rhodanese-like domain-containing protein [Chloroflexota bacterium]|nr:rhodanese-like domain-containing protein [Chloroflexota bacterium]